MGLQETQMEVSDEGHSEVLLTIYKDRVTSLRIYGPLAIIYLLEFVFFPLVKHNHARFQVLSLSLSLSKAKVFS